MNRHEEEAAELERLDEFSRVAKVVKHPGQMTTGELREELDHFRGPSLSDESIHYQGVCLQWHLDRKEGKDPGPYPDMGRI